MLSLVTLESRFSFAERQIVLLDRSPIRRNRPWPAATDRLVAAAGVQQDLGERWVECRRVAPCAFISVNRSSGRLYTRIGPCPAESTSTSGHPGQQSAA